MIRALRLNPSHERAQFNKHYGDYKAALQNRDLARAVHEALSANFYLGMLRGAGQRLEQEGREMMDLDEELVMMLQRG
jgi:hypothetical protein